MSVQINKLETYPLETLDNYYLTWRAKVYWRANRKGSNTVIHSGPTTQFEADRILNLLLHREISEEGYLEFRPQGEEWREVKRGKETWEVVLR